MNFLKRLYKWFLWKFFRKSRRESKVDTQAAFLRSTATLAEKGRASVYRGGHAALNSALLDPNRITYILTIDIGKSRRRAEDMRWFRDYAEREREVL